MRQIGGQVVDRAIHAPGQQVGDQRAGAAIGHMRDIHAGAEFQEFAAHMPRGAIARRGIGQPPRLAASQRQQFLQAVRGHGRMHDHRIGHRIDQRDGCEIPHRIKRQARIEELVDAGSADRAHVQRVAIGVGLGDRLGADIATRAGAVFHHAGLAQQRGETLGHDARGDIGRPATGEAHDDAHGARGSPLRGGRRGQEGGQSEDGAPVDHAAPLSAGAPPRHAASAYSTSGV